MKLIFGFEEKGGPGSGHRGHSGRPGKRGGSMPGSGGNPRGGSGGSMHALPGSGRSPSEILQNLNLSRADNIDESYVHDRLNEKVSQMMASGYTSDDDLQDAVFQFADESLESGESIPDKWFEILDEEIALAREDLGY